MAGSTLLLYNNVEGSVSLMSDDTSHFWEMNLSWQSSTVTRWELCPKKKWMTQLFLNCVYILRLLKHDLIDLSDR